MMNIDQVSQSVNSIVQDTIHKLAQLAPSEVETVCHYVSKRWPDDDEIVGLIRNEAAWILEETHRQELEAEALTQQVLEKGHF